MKRKFLILLFSAFLTTILSAGYDGKECVQTLLPSQTESVQQSSLETSDNHSEYCLPRQNSYSAPSRNLQPVKRTMSQRHTSNIFAANTGKILDINIFLRTLTCHKTIISGPNAPVRRLISLRKLII